MKKEEVQSELRLKLHEDDREHGYHMMATKAYHLLGQISNEAPELCFIYNETEKFYVGNWVYGFGFFNVLFPKETTRELTKEEVEKYNGQNMAINSSPIGKLKIHTKKK